jgi:hypothetical protein
MPIYYYTLLASPLDFIRIYWVITLFDILSLFYIIRQLARGDANTQLARCGLLLYSLLAIIIAISSALNPDSLADGITAMLALLLSAMKGYVIVDSVLRYPRFYSPLLLSYSILSILLLATYFMGFGISGSGRFHGFIGQSNGLAAFQTFALATALSSALTMRTKYAGLAAVTALAVLVLTGSRGSLLSAATLLMLFAVKRTTQLNKVPRILGISLLAILSSVGWSFSEEAATLLVKALHYLDNSGAQRLAVSLENISSGEAFEEFEEARGALNRMAVAFYYANPTLFGHGYDSSDGMFGLPVRVHNLMVNSLIELGAVGALYFSVTYLITGLYYLLSFVRRNPVQTFFGFLFFAFLFQVMKTPFYIINGLSWALPMYALYSLIARPVINASHHRDALYSSPVRR